MTSPSPKNRERANYRPRSSVISGEPFPWRGQRIPDLRKTVSIALNVKENDHGSSDLSLHHFTAVAYVDLDSLTYADSATWKASSPGVTFSTGLLMLVSAAR